MAVILDGGDKLARRFAALTANAQSLTLGAAVVAGAQPIRDEAERLAPKRTGKGAANIGIERGKVTRTRASADIGYDQKDAWYMVFQELGTKRHKHQAHLRPAHDTKKGEATTEVGKVLKLGIDAARRS